MDAKGFRTADARAATSTQCDSQDVILIAPSETDEATAATAAATGQAAATAPEPTSAPTAATARHTHTQGGIQQQTLSHQQAQTASGRTFAEQEPKTQQLAEQTTGGRTSAPQTTGGRTSAQQVVHKQTTASATHETQARTFTEQQQPAAGAKQPTTDDVATDAATPAATLKFQRFLDFCKGICTTLGMPTFLNYNGNIAEIRDAAETCLQELSMDPVTNTDSSSACKVCFLIASMDRDASLELSLATNLLLNVGNRNWVSFYVLTYGVPTDVQANLKFQLEWVCNTVSTKNRAPSQNIRM